MKDTIQEELEFLKEQKAMFLGRMFMEKDDSKKMELFNESEKISDRMTELEKSLSVEETKKEIVEKLQPELRVAELIENSKSNFDVGNFSKILEVNGMGRNNLFKWLRGSEILMKGNLPYQKYAKYFKVIPFVINGEVKNKTLIRPEGIKFVIKKLIEDDIIITKDVSEIISELENVTIE